tara:strand:+ start:4867 stop:5256 length:390 start_codon:yes stop_codon:yes gene_type:complete
MKVLKEEIVFNCSAQNLWIILSDISRCDWVPSVEKINITGDCRVFEMEGMGSVTERILINDDKDMILQYSAIKTRTPLNHHLATMKISPVDENRCNLTWITEIDPEMFSKAIHHGMLISIDGIKRVLES